MIWGDETPQVAVNTQDAGAGQKSIEITVDGQRVDLAEQSCGAGGCSQQRTYNFQPNAYAEGWHDVAVTSTDYVGNYQTESWRVFVKPYTPDPQTDVSDPTADQPATSSTQPADDPGAEVPGDTSGMNGNDNGRTYYSTGELQCPAEDPYVVNSSVDYADLNFPLGDLGLSLPSDPATPQAALARYVTSGVTLPPMPASAFVLDNQTSDYAVFRGVKPAGMDAYVTLERTQYGWQALGMGACSMFVDYYLHHPGGT
jgi:hypothetical protein